VFQPGAQIAIYPAPALPAITVTPITDGGVNAVRAAAEDAGLLGPSHRASGSDGTITTTFTYVDRAGTPHIVSITGLGPSRQPAIQKLAALRDKLSALQTWLPHGASGAPGAYDFTVLQVAVADYARAKPAVVEPPVAWPLSVPLDRFGVARAGGRCGVVSGSDLATLRASIRSANEITPWTSGGNRYALTFHPLLPGESGCAPSVA
jgi:hypothetical protein